MSMSLKKCEAKYSKFSGHALCFHIGFVICLFEQLNNVGIKKR